MIRLAPAAFACLAGAMPPLVARETAVMVICLMGLLLAATGLVALWRWPLTGAAGVFVLAYAVALLIADAAPNVGVAAGLGLAIFLLLQSADIALRAHRTAAGAGILGRQLGRWLVLGAGVMAAAMLGVVLAMALAPALPVAASPLLAAAAALGVVLGIAAVAGRAARRRVGEKA